VSGPSARTLTPSERDWLAVRSYLVEHRYDLGVDAAADYPPGGRVAGTPLLAAPGWQPPGPVPLAEISLKLADGDPDTPGEAAVATPLLPERADGTRYRRYSEAMGELAAPLVFENRVTYRLTDADLSSRAPRLAFTVGRYFDGVDVGEAAAHEYAAARLGGPRPEAQANQAPASGAGSAGLRKRFADPCDLRRRPANLAISTLTLRLDRQLGRAWFLLHRRDPAKVGHAGGLYQVIPVGVFQPSGEAPWNRQHDFSLWRCMVREFAEELGGHPEDYASDSGPVDYDSWPFARQLTHALDRGQVRVWCVGLGTDPLTYATDLLTVAVIDSDVFDALFGKTLQVNDEGEILAEREFAAHVIDRTVTGDPMQAAGAALLRLAWQHRDTLGG
jgi:hypothetical protein